METSQKRAIRSYRTRLKVHGLARFEVLGRHADRDLIRSLARRLSEDGPDASRLRAVVSQSISGKPPKKGGGILAALRRSPLVDADLDLTRPREKERKVEISCALLSGALGAVTKAETNALPARHHHHQQRYEAGALQAVA